MTFSNVSDRIHMAQTVLGLILKQPSSTYIDSLIIPKTTAYFNIHYWKKKDSHNLQVYTALTPILYLSKQRLRWYIITKSSDLEPCLPVVNRALSHHLLKRRENSLLANSDLLCVGSLACKTVQICDLLAVFLDCSR